MDQERKITSYVTTLSPEQVSQLEALLRDRGWTFSTQPYAYWKAVGNKVNAVAYHSGKLTVQGGETADFVTFVLEPEILHTFEFGQEALLPPEPMSFHGGIDESGKGDFFGPLVVAGVCVGPENGPRLREAGVCDSKLVKSSRRIIELAGTIRRLAPEAWSVLVLPPETYNRLYGKFGNLNRMLAWGHARVIENLLEKVPDCPRCLSDQFGDPRLIQRALLTRGRSIQLDQEVRAERDVAVAAASILAREQFLKTMARLGSELGQELPRGAGAEVRRVAEELVRRLGAERLGHYVKTHFKTYAEITAQGGSGE